MALSVEWVWLLHWPNDGDQGEKEREETGRREGGRQKAPPPPVKALSVKARLIGLISPFYSSGQIWPVEDERAPDQMLTAASLWDRQRARPDRQTTGACLVPVLLAPLTPQPLVHSVPCHSLFSLSPRSLDRGFTRVLIRESSEWSFLTFKWRDFYARLTKLCIRTGVSPSQTRAEDREESLICYRGPWGISDIKNGFAPGRRPGVSKVQIAHKNYDTSSLLRNRVD